MAIERSFDRRTEKREDIKGGKMRKTKKYGIKFVWTASMGYF